MGCSTPRFVRLFTRLRAGLPRLPRGPPRRARGLVSGPRLRLALPRALVHVLLPPRRRALGRARLAGLLRALRRGPGRAPVDAPLLPRAAPRERSGGRSRRGGRISIRIKLGVSRDAAKASRGEGEESRALRRCSEWGIEASVYTFLSRRVVVMTKQLRGASRRWRDTWRHRRDVDVARDANANNAKIIKDAARAHEREAADHEEEPAH